VAICRASWAPGFPEVIVHTKVSVRDAHPDYADAKAGQRFAAVRIANDLLSSEARAEIRRHLPTTPPVLVPVRAIEAAGINLIPDAMAHELGRRLGLPVTSEIIQTNTVGHT